MDWKCCHFLRAAGLPSYADPNYNNGHKRPYGIEPVTIPTSSPRPEVHAALRKVVCYVGRKGRRIVFQSVGIKFSFRLNTKLISLSNPYLLYCSESFLGAVQK